MASKNLFVAWLILLAYALGHLHGIASHSGFHLANALVSIAGAASMAFAAVWPKALLGGIAVTAIYLISDRMADRIPTQSETGHHGR